MLIELQSVFIEVRYYETHKDETAHSQKKYDLFYIYNINKATEL